MPSRTPTVPFRVIRHEAGHAVIAAALGIRVVRLSIEPELATEGAGAPVLAVTTTFHGGDTDQLVAKLERGTASLDRVTAMLCVLFAGAAAQGDRAGSSLDRDKAEAIAFTYCGEARACRALLSFARRRAEELVRQHRRAICRVTRALARHRTLSGRELGRVLRAAA
jgi:hypothetical protein